MRFYFNFCDLMGTIGNTALITFVARYFVAIFVKLHLYVKRKSLGCCVFPCSLCLCIVIFCFCKSYEHKTKRVQSTNLSQ